MPRAGGFAGAAATPHYTPPTVPWQIAALERGAGVTGAGGALLAIADAIQRAVPLWVPLDVGDYPSAFRSQF